MLGCPQELFQALDRYFKPRCDDIIICTFAKSGTTWMQAIVSKLLQVADARVSKSPISAAGGGEARIDDASPATKRMARDGSETTQQPGLPSSSPSSSDVTTASAGDGAGVALGLDPNDRVPWLEGLSSVMGLGKFLKKQATTSRRRAFKTHTPVPLLRHRIVPGVKVIFVERNPKDLCVSLWHHTRSKNFGYDGPFEHFVREVCSCV